MFLRTLITTIFGGTVGILVAGYLALKNPDLLGIGEDDTPEMPVVAASYREVIEPEDCERLVVVPPVFTDQMLRLVIRENAETLQTVPQTYRTVRETVTVTPEHREGDTLEYVQVTVVVEEAAETLQVVPATYERRMKRVMTVEPHLVHHLAEEGTVRVAHHPGEFAEISVISVEEPAMVRRVAIPGKTASLNIQRITEVKGTGEMVPATTRTITRRIIHTPASVRRITAPEDITHDVTVRMVQFSSSVERIAQPCN